MEGEFNINWFDIGVDDQKTERRRPNSTDPEPTPYPKPTDPGGGNCEEQCQWYSDSPRPLCKTQSTNWGWENNQSCIGRTLCETGQENKGGILKVCR